MSGDSFEVPPGKRVTTADVARASGVSRATVSYVLNDAPNRSISAATRELVLRTAAELGHVPYAPARALRTGTPNIVLTLVPGFSIGFVFDLTLDRLNRELARRDIALLVTRQGDLAEGLSLRQLLGIVTPTVVLAMGGLAEAEREVFAQSRVPVVDDVGFLSHTRMGEMQAEYLISRGHTRLGFAFPEDPAIERYASQRLAGASSVAEREGIAPPIVEQVTTQLDQVRETLRAWMDAGVTAICAHNDDVALVLMAGLTSMGLTAGRDLAIIGVDDIPGAGVGLTTIAIDTDVFSELVVSTVLAALDNRPRPAVESDALRLVVRDSA